VAKIEIKDLERIRATDAKVFFGELLHESSIEGKKFAVYRHGRPVCVVIGYKEYLRLVEQVQKKS
jgi:prevent-host-death family protein